MIWLIKFLFLGHVHKWKTLSRKEMTYRAKTVDGRTKSEDYVRVQCECEICGVPRHWDLRA